MHSFAPTYTKGSMTPTEGVTVSGSVVVHSITFANIGTANETAFGLQVFTADESESYMTVTMISSDQTSGTKEALPTYIMDIPFMADKGITVAMEISGGFPSNDSIEVTIFHSQIGA